MGNGNVTPYQSELISHGVRRSVADSRFSTSEDEGCKRHFAKRATNILRHKKKRESIMPIVCIVWKKIKRNFNSRQKITRKPKISHWFGIRVIEGLLAVNKEIKEGCRNLIYRVFTALWLLLEKKTTIEWALFQVYSEVETLPLLFVFVVGVVVVLVHTAHPNYSQLLPSLWNAFASIKHTLIISQIVIIASIA